MRHVWADRFCAGHFCAGHSPTGPPLPTLTTTPELYSQAAQAVAQGAGVDGGPGRLAGLVGSFIPRWSGHGESLAAVAMALLMVAFIRRWTGGGRRVLGSLLLGLGAGVAIHVQPALIPVVLE